MVPGRPWKKASPEAGTPSLNAAMRTEHIGKGPQDLTRWEAGATLMRLCEMEKSV